MAGTLPRDCFGAEWTAAEVFRGLETLSLYPACPGGLGRACPPSVGWE